MSQGSLEISIEETIIFILFNIILILIGLIFWYFLWIRPKLIEIFEDTNNIVTYFSSRNLYLIISRLLSKISSFDQETLKQTIGYEAYIYLFFQRRIIGLLLSYFLFSFIITFITFILNTLKSDSSYKLTDFFINIDYFDNITSTLHIIIIALFTFLHFRAFTAIKKESKYIYFARFDKMSQNYDEKWLSCRTLHISGISPEERNTSVLQTKLNFFLSKSNSGHVFDINFVPNYINYVKLEKKRNEINDLKLLVTQNRNKCIKFFFNSIYWSESAVTDELDIIENKLQLLTLEPVLSSGHAFICFDSLTAAYRVLNKFQDSAFNNFKVKLLSLFDRRKKRTSFDSQSQTFQRFNDEYESNYQIEENNMNDNMNIVVDQMIEPCDIIWDNMGGDRGLFFWRRLFLNILALAVLVFFTTPASFLNTIKVVDYFKVHEYKWIKISFGYIIVTYGIPLIILGINLAIIILIDYVARFEKHYTHSSYHYAVFGKSFIYMLFNFLIIPGIALTAESLYNIIKHNYNSIFELLSNLYLSNSGSFFITLIVQNGTISSIFYLLRLDELLFNALSTEVTFYKRHFINLGKAWQRDEDECFLFGYFYAQFLVFYTICLVFSSTVPIISLAGLYLFTFRHFGDFASFVTVHGKEIDSNGKLINHILNFTCIPVVLYHLFMMSVFLAKKKYHSAIGVGIIMILSIVYIVMFNSKYLIDIYSLHENLGHYEDEKKKIGNNEVNKWRNRFKHPVCLPIFVDEETAKFDNEMRQSRKEKIVSEGKERREIRTVNEEDNNKNE